MVFKKRQLPEAPWSERPGFRIKLPSGRVLDTSGRPLVMGILNVTPDSFSDGGRFASIPHAVRRAHEMAEQGADIIDVGGESTRPGSDAVSVDEERDRVVPVIAQVAAELDVPISVDTQKASVADEAVMAGAEIINDVSALRSDVNMAHLVSERGCPVVLMHMQGTPKNMQQDPQYGDVVADVSSWLRERCRHALAAGIREDRIIIDPGFGFGKTVQHNLELLRRLHELHALGHPILLGTSRKSTIGAILGQPEDGRAQGTLATVAVAALAGCHIMRCHDVQWALEVIKVCEAVRLGADYDHA